MKSRTIMQWLRQSLCCLAVALVFPAVAEQPVRVAVASNFVAPMQVIAEQFTQQTGYQVQVVSGSSGKFATQIQQGAPFDLFLSADQARPALLQQKGFVADHKRVTYAVGQLALWSAQPGLIDNDAGILHSDNIARLAIANPRLAPYGVAAVATLKKLSAYKKYQNQLVQGENIAQTFHFVSTGNVPLGFVAFSQLAQDDRGGSFWRVPADYHPPILQDMVLLKSAEANPAAEALWQYLQSPPARRIINEFGYLTQDKLTQDKLTPDKLTPDEE